MKKLIFFFTTLFIQTSFGQIIPTDRRADWSNAGYHGNRDLGAAIVDVTTFGAIGDGLTDNTTAINAAMNSFGGNRGVVYFPAGNFLIGSSLNLPDSIILKGEGADSSHLVFNMNGTIGNCINIIGSGSGTPTTVLNGFYRGSSYIIVSDPSTFAAGDYANLLETNGAWDIQPAAWAASSIGQILHLNSVSGDTLFFDAPLRINYDIALQPQVSKFTPATEIGIECLKISRADSIHTGLCLGIYFYYASNCWIRGVESSTSIGSHIEADRSTNISISGCHIHHNYEYDGTSTHGYGITLFDHSGQCLIENNVMEHLRHSFSLQTGANGNVIAYNYSRDPNRSEAPSNYGADISLHGHFPYANLFEGNIVQNVNIDQTWGPSGPFNTFFRNRIELYGIIMSTGSVQSDSVNFVGNDVINTGFLLGNYILYGAGHLQDGNTIRGTMTPAGTGNFTDSSYYLSTVPSFWTSVDWPTIGPNHIGSNNPAYDRFASAQPLTVCMDPFFDQISNADESGFTLYPNPISSSFRINTEEKIERVLVYDITGEIQLEKCNNEKVIDLPSGIANGIYFVRIETEKKTRTFKVIVDR